MRRASLLPLAVGLALALAARALAQDATPPPMMEKAPVVLDGRVLFEVGESGTWSPQLRAAEIARVLRAAVDDPSLPLYPVLAERDGYPTVRMGDWHLVTVTEADVLPGMAAGEQAQRWMQTVEDAVVEARRERTPAYRTEAAFMGAAALLVAALLHWLFGRVSRRVPLRLSPRLGVRSETPGGKPLWHSAIELACVAAQAGLWLAAAAYIVAAFPGSRQARYDATALVARSFHAPLFAMGGRSYSALDLVWVVGAAVGLWIAVSVFISLLSRRLQLATGAARGAFQPAATLAKYALIACGLIVILQVAGLDLSSLALFASVIGVGIGFGLQSIANNFVSGVILSFERPIKPGDYIRLGEIEGTVQRIGGRSTIIRTLDRVSLIVPNARLLESEVVNWNYGDDLVRMHVPVGVAYGCDIDAVRAALLDAARSHPAVLADPRSDVRFVGFGESSLDFALLVWTADPAGQAALKSDLYYRIEANLRRAGIEVPFPQRTLHLAADEIGAVLDRWRAPAGGGAVALYDPHGAPAHLSHNGGPPARSAVAQAAASAPSLDSVDLDALAARMRGAGGIPIADRRHLLSTYPKCFVGADAVAWLISEEEVTRSEAIRLGQSLIERGIIHHVLDEHPFRDGHFFYRFYADE